MDSATGESGTAKVLEGLFDFDPKDAVYKNHFPGRPVVPGSFIIHAFLEAAKDCGWIAGRCRVEAFRFLRFVYPGECRFRMASGDDNNVLHCKLYFQGRVAAKGRLIT